jgi:hypothetical protein
MSDYVRQACLSSDGTGNRAVAILRQRDEEMSKFLLVFSDIARKLNAHYAFGDEALKVDIDELRERLTACRKSVMTLFKSTTPPLKGGGRKGKSSGEANTVTPGQPDKGHGNGTQRRKNNR